MKLLLKTESDIRCSTRSELIRRPTGSIRNVEELHLRASYLESQLKHSFHLTEQICNALSEQFLIIRQLDDKIKEKDDELNYLQSYTASRLIELQDDLNSAFTSNKEYKPTPNPPL